MLSPPMKPFSQLDFHSRRMLNLAHASKLLGSTKGMGIKSKAALQAGTEMCSAKNRAISNLGQTQLAIRPGVPGICCLLQTFLLLSSKPKRFGPDKTGCRSV